MNDKLVVIHQPDFLPYIGFFARLLQADIYVVLDNVQYVRGSKDHWTNRDQIKTQNGAKWITVSVKKASRDVKINDVLLSEEHHWRNRCKNLLTACYAKAKYYDEIKPYIDKMFGYQCTHLMEFNLNIIYIINQLLDIQVETVFASALNAQGHKDLLLIDIMDKLGQKYYLAGEGARTYCNEKKYEEKGIALIWQRFQHPVYKQQFGEFVPYLSIIDLLCNCGIRESRSILRESVVDRF